MTYQEEHAAIVDQLRRQGWDRLDAIEEADRLMQERTERRQTDTADDICIDCFGKGRYPSGKTCISCGGTGRVLPGDGARP